MSLFASRATGIWVESWNLYLITEISNEEQTDVRTPRGPLVSAEVTAYRAETSRES